MRIFALIFITAALAGCSSFDSFSGTGLVKVLPHYLDESGRHTDGVTLLHRDGFQNRLRKNPELVHGVSYEVNWYGSGELTVRLELRSTKAGTDPMVLEQAINGTAMRTHWTPMLLDAKTYKIFGQPQAWRVTLWRGDQQIDMQKSFLW
jgi:hypothetical protein